MRTMNPYVLVLAVSAVLILQVALARDASLVASSGEGGSAYAFVARLDLLIADVLFVALVFLMLAGVRDYVRRRESRDLRRVLILVAMFIVLGAFHPTLFTQEPYDQVGPNSLFPLFVDLLILGGLVGAWWYGKRQRDAQRADAKPSPAEHGKG